MCQGLWSKKSLVSKVLKDGIELDVAFPSVS